MTRLAQFVVGAFLLGLSTQLTHEGNDLAGAVLAVGVYLTACAVASRRE